MKLIFFKKSLLLQTVLIFLLINCNYAKDWWENGNFYQIYPRSFHDSDGDGIGDLNGITEKLQYLKDIGITGAWLSPIFKSPMADFGYDISDYYKIHPEYGTMEDFENLIRKAKKIGIHIFLDFVPNHTSDENDWFIKSVNRIDPYTDYYVWHNGKIDKNGKRSPPSNWLSAFRYSAWEWNEKRQQYYLHQFAIKQPDLNYRNDNVVKEMKNVLKFWLNKGISGFRIDAVPYLFEIDKNQHGDYPDEPKSNDTNCQDNNDQCYLKHIYTQDQPETYDMIYQWHDLINEFKKENGSRTRILLTEAYTSLDNIIKFYGDGNRNGSNVPFNFELLTKLNNKTTAKDISNIIDSWMNKMPKDVHANWVLGNHDNKRITTRLGKDRADLFNIMLQTLPGIAVTYNGEEIAMNDVYIDWEHTVDPQACNTNSTIFDSFSRDTARTPFQWDASKYSGFTRGSETWLPVSNDYKTNNVLMQSRAPISHLQIFKKLLKLRQEPSFQDGTLDKKVIDNDILLYKRELPGSDKYIIVLNLGFKEQQIKLKQYFNDFNNKSEVLITSIQSNYTDGDIIDSDNFIAYPRVGTVIVGIK